MPVDQTVFASDTEPLHPDSIYPLSAFIRASGITHARITDAAKSGILLTKLKVGRRVFVRSADGIRFIEQVAAASIEGDEA